MGGDVEIGIVFGEADEEDIVGTERLIGLAVVSFEISAVEVRKIVVGHGAGKLDGAVSAKVEVEEGVIFGDLTDGLVILVDNDEGREILVLEVRGLGAQSFDGGFGIGELVIGLAVKDGIPTGLDDAPITFVAVGDENHAAATGGDLAVKIGVLSLDFFDEKIEFVDVFFSRLRRSVAAI